jgi:hypothetical protein
MKKIFLLHQTDIININDIIDNKYLLPSSITERQHQNPYNVYLPYIFMSCCYKKDFKDLFTYTLIFEIDILYDRCFYINDHHACGDIKSSLYFKKYTPFNNIYNELLILLLNSKKIPANTIDFIKKFPFYFVIHQEIFFRKKVDINDAKYIILPKVVDSNLVNKIKNNFPNLKIIFLNKI